MDQEELLAILDSYNCAIVEITNARIVLAAAEKRLRESESKLLNAYYPATPGRV